MKKELVELKKQIDAENKNIWEEEPEELKKLRFGIIENEAGSYGQYFTTWDFAQGMLRDYAGYTLYTILKFAKDEKFNLEQLKEMFKQFTTCYTPYLGYSGFVTLEIFAQKFIDLLDTIDKKEDFMELLISLLKYTNKLVAWEYHYFPWELGALYPQTKKKDIAEMAKLAKI